MDSDVFKKLKNFEIRNRPRLFDMNTSPVTGRYLALKYVPTWINSLLLVYSAVSKKLLFK